MHNTTIYHCQLAPQNFEMIRSMLSQYERVTLVSVETIQDIAKAYMKPIEDVNGTKAATIYLPKGKRLYDEKSLKEISSDILEAD